MSEFARLPRSMPFVFMLTFQVISRSLKVPLMRSPHASLECWTARRTNAHIDFVHTSSCEPTAVCAHTEFAPETNEKEIKDKWARVRTSERVTEQVCNRCANIHKKKYRRIDSGFSHDLSPSVDECVRTARLPTMPWRNINIDLSNVMWNCLNKPRHLQPRNCACEFKKKGSSTRRKEGDGEKKKSYRQMVIVDNLLT